MPITNKSNDFKLNGLYKIFNCIFAIVTVLQCESIFDSSAIGEILINGIWQVLLFIGCIYSLNNTHVNNVYITKLTNFLFIYFPLVFILLILYYIYSPFTLFYFMLILIDPIMLVSYFISISGNKGINKYLFYKIEDFVVILAGISFVFWILETMGMKPNMSTTIKWGGPHSIQGFDYIQFIPQTGTISFLGRSLIRNSGIFVEATIFSYLLCTALLIELFMRKKVSKPRIAFLFIVICSTTSTTGLIVSLLAISYYVFISVKSSYKYLFLLLIPIIFLIIKFIFLNKVYSAGSSYGERQLEWHMDVIDWNRHLFIGNGLPSIGSNGASKSLVAVGLSSGLMASLAYGGIILSMFYILPSVLSLKVSKKVLGISVLSFILFTYTIIMNFYMYVIVLSYLWVAFLCKNIKSYKSKSYD